LATTFTARSKRSHASGSSSISFGNLDLVMPYPLKGSYTLRQGPQTVAKRPECAIGIAVVAAEWAALERKLAEGVGASLFMWKRGEIAAELVTRNVLNSIDSLNSRMDIIDRLLTIHVSRELREQFSTTLRPEIRRRAGERATVVHGNWAICDKFPSDLILHPSSGDDLRYTAKCFQQITNRITATTRQAAKFIELIRDEMADKPPLR
jgi:hypothetical protein